MQLAEITIQIILTPTFWFPEAKAQPPSALTTDKARTASARPALIPLWYLMKDYDFSRKGLGV